ncbi:MAG: nuclear transport factor 2 family protein [Rhodospirillaceae bacterium]|jgi:ketosteroid isomerase-like protein|nr:nuclear transport factor 2 family protein [Rhodospirillaceae bacterium]
MIDDQRDIADLLYHYFQIVDDGLDEEIPSFFTEDGVFDGITGRMVIHQDLDKFVAGIKAMRDGAFAHMRHFTSDMRISVNGDTATARSCVLVTGKGTDGSFKIAATGKFLDTLRRTPSGWKFVERVAKVDGA